MKLLKWLFEPQFSGLEALGIILISVISYSSSDWFLLLYIPLFIVNGFINTWLFLSKYPQPNVHVKSLEEAIELIKKNGEERNNGLNIIVDNPINN
jgi:hypothetical protein